MNAASNGFGISRVLLLDGPRVDGRGVGRLTLASELSDMYSYPKPIILLRHTYLFYAKRVEQQVDVAAAWDGTGPALYVKEPKLTCHSIGPVGGPRYRWFWVYSREGEGAGRRVRHLVAARPDGAHEADPAAESGAGSSSRTSPEGTR
jgi:hypothetical protein